MFEYWFFGIVDPQDPKDFPPLNRAGATHDFLEFLCQIAQDFGSITAGNFTAALLAAHDNELTHLRVVPFDFEFKFKNNGEAEQTIRLLKS